MSRKPGVGLSRRSQTTEYCCPRPSSASVAWMMPLIAQLASPSSPLCAVMVTRDVRSSIVTRTHFEL